MDDFATAVASRTRVPARDERSGLLYRPETVDLAIIRGETRAYVRRLGGVAGARVLDIGAHVGGAALRFLEAGAALVVAVEADPDNFAVLRRNANRPGILAMHAAVVGDDREITELWRNNRPRSTALHSLTPHRGRRPVEVPALNVSRLVEEHAITHVKIDCEGGEYAILAAPLAASVRALVVEFHANHRAWLPHIAPTLASLYQQGFHPDLDPPTRPTPTAWVWTVGWRR